MASQARTSSVPARPVVVESVEPEARPEAKPEAKLDVKLDTKRGHVLSQDCSRIGEVLSRIGDKWTVMVVVLLREGARRFSEIKREIGGVSQRMLTMTLRGLERDGVVTRTVYPTTPPRVDYELTPLGHSLREPVEALGDWALAHLDVIDQARREFDSRSKAAPVPVAQGASQGLTLPSRTPPRSE